MQIAENYKNKFSALCTKNKIVKLHKKVVSQG
nr:MAG TPA: hypothetical protein [Caudoviricetes sp.]